jgi:hypothetical protein
MSKHLFFKFLGCVFMLGGMMGCNPDFPDGPTYSVFPVDYKVKTTWRWALNMTNGKNLTSDWQDRTIEFKKDSFKVVNKNGENIMLGLWSSPTNNTKLQLLYNDSLELVFTINKMKLNEMYLVVPKAAKVNGTAVDSIRWELTTDAKRPWHDFP